MLYPVLAKNQALTGFAQVLFSCLHKQCVNKGFLSPHMCHEML